MTTSLRVFCPETELAEDGLVVRVGDHVRRLATPRIAHRLGTVDALPWAFDQYAEYVGDPVSLVGGRVSAIDAVYARLTELEDGSWGLRPGSEWTEPVPATSATRRPAERIDWQPLSPPDAEGHQYGVGFPVFTEGDETHVGWVFTLQDAVVEDVPTEG